MSSQNRSPETNNNLPNLEHDSQNFVLLQTGVSLHSLRKNITRLFSKETELPFSEQVANAVYDRFKNTLRKKKNPDGTPVLSAKCLRAMEFLGAPLISSVFEKKEDADFWDKIIESGVLLSIRESLQNSGVEQQEIELVITELQDYQQQAQSITNATQLRAYKRQDKQDSQEYTTYVDTEIGKEIRNQNTTIQQTYEAEKVTYTQNATEVADSPRAFNVPPREKGEYIWTIPYRFDRIQSGKFERSSSGCTLCSKTARENAEKFWINVPSGNAYDAGKKQPIDDTFKLSVGKTRNPIERNTDLASENFSTLQGKKEFQQSNVADIYTTSSSPYGHRAFAFLNQTDGQRYVLDPYPKAIEKSTKPITLEEYKQKTGRAIVHAKFYQSPHYIV